jgi:Fic family protein
MNEEIDKIREKTEAMEKRLDNIIEEIKKHNEIIFAKPVPTGKLLTIEEVAKMSGLSRLTVTKDIKLGRLKSIERGQRKFIPQDIAKKYTNY